MPTLGQDAGIFKKHGLVLDNFGTAGRGRRCSRSSPAAPISASAVGVAGVMRVFSKGAPVRVLLPAFTGTGDLYWYVKADSPPQGPDGHDRPEHHRLFDQRLELQQHRWLRSWTISASRRSRSRPARRRDYHRVMSGQVDIGWARFPSG